MNNSVAYNYRQPAILIVSNTQKQLTSNSPILGSFNLVHNSFQEPETLLWIQQHQPDLIILDLEWSQSHLELVITLKLDWLTRDIPIVVVVDSVAQQLCLSADIDYEACLIRPYAVAELEKNICSLVSTFDCKPYLKAG